MSFLPLEKSPNIRNGRNFIFQQNIVVKQQQQQQLQQNTGLLIW